MSYKVHVLNLIIFKTKINHWCFLLLLFLFIFFSLKGGRELEMDWSRSQARIKWKRFLLLFFLFFNNLLLSVYGIQISSNPCYPHYFCFFPPKDILRLPYLFLRSANRIIGWRWHLCHHTVGVLVWRLEGLP